LWISGHVFGADLDLLELQLLDLEAHAVDDLDELGKLQASLAALAGRGRCR